MVSPIRLYSGSDRPPIPKSLTEREIADLFSDLGKLLHRERVAVAGRESALKVLAIQRDLLADCKEMLETPSDEIDDEELATLIGRVVEALDGIADGNPEAKEN